MHPQVRSRDAARAATVNTTRRETLLPRAWPLARAVPAGAHQHPRPAVLCAQLPAAMSPRRTTGSYRRHRYGATARRKSRTSTNHLLAETGHLALRLRLAASHTATLRPNDSIAASTDQHPWSNLSDSANRLCSNIVRDG